jgi:hypothetical protein
VCACVCVLVCVCLCVCVVRDLGSGGQSVFVRSGRLILRLASDSSPSLLLSERGWYCPVSDWRDRLGRDDSMFY